MAEGSDLLARYRATPAAPTAAPPARDDGATPGDGGAESSATRGRCFRANRQTPALMVQYTFAGGDRLAMPYTYLCAVKFDASVGITAEYADRSVTIEGARLGAVYTALIGHLLVEVREAQSEFTGAEPEPHVRRLTVRERQ